jgi:hypothetical protein
MKNTSKPTLAKQIDWSKIPILTTRPEGMDFETYRLQQKLFQYVYKLYRRYGS